MKGQLKQQGGFTLIEAVVAITLITIGALALATTFVGAAATNKRVSERQQAIALARQQIDRLRSLDYGEVALFDANADNNPDWKTAFCPLRLSSTPKCKELVISAGALASKGAEDPRQPKSSPQRPTTSTACTTSGSSTTCPTVRRNGIILYTYVYWNNWLNNALGKQYKLVTVVARFADPKPGLPETQVRRYTTVTLTSVVADIPEVGQVR